MKLWSVVPALLFATTLACPLLMVPSGSPAAEPTGLTVQLPAPAAPDVKLEVAIHQPGFELPLAPNQFKLDGQTLSLPALAEGTKLVVRLDGSASTLTYRFEVAGGQLRPPGSAPRNAPPADAPPPPAPVEVPAAPQVEAATIDAAGVVRFPPDWPVSGTSVSEIIMFKDGAEAAVRGIFGFDPRESKLVNHKALPAKYEILFASGGRLARGEYTVVKAVQPVAAQPVAAQPVAAQPVAAQPVAAGGLPSISFGVGGDLADLYQSLNVPAANQGEYARIVVGLARRWEGTKAGRRPLVFKFDFTPESSVTEIARIFRDTAALLKAETTPEQIVTIEAALKADFAKFYDRGANRFSAHNAVREDWQPFLQTLEQEVRNLMRQRPEAANVSYQRLVLLELADGFDELKALIAGIEGSVGTGGGDGRTADGGVAIGPAEDGPGRRARHRRCRCRSLLFGF